MGFTLHKREFALLAIITIGVATIGVFAPTILAQDTNHTSIPPRIGLSENNSRIVYPESVEGAGYGTPDLSVTDSLATNSANTESTLARYSFETKLERTDNESQRQAIARNGTAYFRMKANSLHALETQSRAQFNAGEISEQAYLRELGMIHRRTDSLKSAISNLQSNPRMPGEADEVLQTIQGDLIGLQGPMRSQVATAVHGEGDAREVFVSASSDGVTLSTLDDGWFTHIAYIPANRDTVYGDISILRGFNITKAYYPVLMAAGGTQSFSAQGTDIFQFTIGDDATRTTGYMDATTQQIFYEIHQTSLDHVGTDPLITATGNNTTLTVTDSYVGGPLQIRVENRTGSPIQATVFINQTQMGQTDEAGTYWTIAEKPPYPVRVNTQEANLSVNITSYRR